MRKKLVYRLMMTYSLLLLFFATISFGLFFVLLNNQEKNIHIKQVENQARIVAEGLEQDHQDNKRDNPHGMMHVGRSYDAYIQLMEDITVDHMWIVNDSGQNLVKSRMMMHDNSDNVTLTDSAKAVFYEVLEEGIPIKKLTKSPNRLIYGVPLKDESAQLFGVVLMESSLSRLLVKQSSDYTILFISLVITLILTIVIAIYVSKKFVSPIFAMKKFTVQLIDEDYDAKLDIQTEDELADLSNQLLTLRNRLKIAKKNQLNKDKSQRLFLSQVSHELRTPVMIIRNSLNLLSDDHFSSEYERNEYVIQMTQEMYQLERLVNDLLELSRLQSLEFSLNLDVVNLSDVVEDAKRSFRGIIHETKHQLVIDNQLSNPPLVLADHMRLVQLLKILMDNSVKYSPKKSSIRLTISDDHDNYCLSVENETTKVMSQSELEESFEAFKRGSDNQHIDGHGLGLTIAKQIIERHKGNIQIEFLRDHVLIISICLPKYQGEVS